MSFSEVPETEVTAASGLFVVITLPTLNVLLLILIISDLLSVSLLLLFTDLLLLSLLSLGLSWLALIITYRRAVVKILVQEATIRTLISDRFEKLLSVYVWWQKLLLAIGRILLGFNIGFEVVVLIVIIDSGIILHYFILLEGLLATYLAWSASLLAFLTT